MEANPDGVQAYRRIKDMTRLARFYRPIGIAIDEQDRIIVVDGARHRLQVYAKDKSYTEPEFNL